MKKTDSLILLTIIRFRWLIAICVGLTAFLVSSEQAEAHECDSTKITNHFTLVFDGVTYDQVEGTSKWDYYLTWDGEEPELSYFFIQLCHTLKDSNLVAVEPSNGEIGYNGNLDRWGIKWDDITSFPADTSILFSFTINRLLEVDHTYFAPKAGVNSNIAKICGPSKYCDTLESPCTNNEPPSAICPGDTTIFLCGLSEICIPGFGGFDDGGIAEFVVEGGIYDNGTVCFFPQEGANVIRVIVTDSCLAADTCETVVYVINASDIVASWQALSIDGQMSPPPYGMRLDGFFDGIGDKEVTFNFDKVRFDEFANGFARLHGTISVAEYDNTGGPGSYSSSWDLDVFFELVPDSIAQTVVNPYDPNYRYFSFRPDLSTEMLNLEDAGDFANLFEWPVDGRRPLQVGYGANEKNDNYGAAGWISYVHNDNGTIYGDSMSYFTSSDFLMDLVPIECRDDTTVYATENYDICIPGFECFGDSCYVVNDSFFNWDGSSVCFYADTNGTYVINFVTVDDCGIEDTCTTIVNVFRKSPPVCNLPPDSSTILICEGRDTCLVIGALDPDDDLVGCYILDGPGEIIDDTLWCYTPAGNETVTVTIQCVDSLGLECTSSFTVEFVVTETPITVSVDTTDAYLCDMGQLYCVPLTINNSAETFTVQTENGTYNPEDSTICISADTTGRYCNLVIVTNDCGTADTVEYCIDVNVNSSPVVVCPVIDTILYCGIDFPPIAIPGFEYFDVDENIVSVEVSDGILSGDTLYFDFFPADTIVTLIVTDSCGQADTCQTIIPIKTNSDPVLTTPGYQEVELCQADSICFDISAIDVDDNLYEFGVLNRGFEVRDGQVCFYADTSGTYVVAIYVSDNCLGTDVNVDTIVVKVNEAPVVNLPDSQQMTLCVSEVLCFNYSVSDVDNNIDSIWSSYGYIDNGRLCFMADTSGVYNISIFAVDSCGEAGSDSIIVTIDLNQPPVISFGDDFTVENCSTDSICIPYELIDDNTVSVSSNASVVDGTVCFLPDTSGQYTIWVLAIDNCELTDADTIVVIVTVPPPPFVEIGNDFRAIICDTTEFCINVETIDNYASIEFNRVGFNPQTGQFCFTAEHTILDLLIVTVTDSCGRIAADSLPVYIQFNTAPEVEVALPDTTIYLCQPDYVCLPMVFADSQNNIIDITVSHGTYENGQICFVPYDSGTYTIIATATDSCGAVTVDTGYVTIITDQYVNLQCPNDTSIFQCILDTLCFPIGDIPEWAEIEVTGINTWYDQATQSVCFYVECGVQNKITVYAITDCDTISCDFTVDVQCNLPPVVFLPQDTSINLCAADSIYIPVGISDPNGNLYSINTDSWVDYSPATGKLSFYADSNGTYLLSVTAVDSCELVTNRQVRITVQINEAPVCVMPEDTSIFLCEPVQIIRPVYGTDDSQIPPVCTVVDGPGEIIDGYWTYQAAITEEVKVVVECVDNCEQICRDSFYVSIEVNEAPVCDIPSDTSIFQCTPTEICLPISAQDADGNLIGCSLISGPGSLSSMVGKNPGGSESMSTGTVTEWCYTPTKDTSFTVVIRCADSCGLSCTDSFTVTIELNEAPMVTCPGDTSLFLCSLEEINLPGFAANDPDGQIVSAFTSVGQLNGDTVVFTPQYGENMIVFTALDNCELSDVCTTYVYVDTNSAPICQVPNDTTITGCVSDQICLPVGAIDVDENLLGCEIADGPGTLDNGFWCYTPKADDTVTVVIRCIDECSKYCEDSFTVIFEGGTSPTIEDQFFSYKYCGDIASRQLQIEASNNIDDPTVFGLISDNGTINSISGVITYLPDTPGVYSFVVEASNTCGSDTATVYDTITINRPPSLVGYDSTVYLCSVQEICFNIVGADPDNDSLEIVMTQGLGQFTQLNSISGQTCFTPDNVDSATYLFVYRVTDLCPVEGQEPYNYYYDTVTITVIVDQPPVIEIPPFFSIFSCNPDSVCFEIPPFDPNDYPFSVQILSGNAMLYGDTMVCLFINGTGDYLVSIEVTDSCGNSDTVSSTIHVDVNTPPVVTLEDDFSVKRCDTGLVCFDISVTDNENNISDIFSSLGTVYGTDSVCFNADTSGTYMIIVTAVDSCGAQHFDAINVTVDLNTPPVVSLGDDFKREICSGDSICLPFSIIDDNLFDYYSNFSIVDGTVCFTADTSGQFAVWVSAIDSCEIVSADTVIVTVVVPPPPFVEIGNDFRAIICDTTEFCIDVETIDNYASIEFNRVGFNPQTGQFCFTAEHTILDLLVVTVTDSCGRAVSDSLPVYVQFNTAPEVEIAMPDTTVYICQPTYICLPVQFADSQNNITEITVNRGTYENGQVCFVPYDSGTYTIIATATDSCGAIVSDTAYVTVITDQYVNLECPNDTTIFQCQLDTICFPIGDIPEWADIQVTGINTWYDPQTQNVCFYVTCGVANKITVSAITACDTIKCSFTVNVKCNKPPVVFLPGDTTIIQCEFDSIYIPVGISDPNNNLASVTTSVGALYNPVIGRVSFLPNAEGIYTIQVNATDSCDVSDSDIIQVNVRLNRNPEIEFGIFDTVFALCAPQEICLPVMTSDSDGNISFIVPSIGYYNAQNQQICFTPTDSFGLYCINVVVTDSCGLADTATQCITIESDGVAFIQCPDGPIYDTLCFADSVCTQLSLVGEPDSITASIGSIVDGFLCIYADTTGTYLTDITIYSACTTLTCQIEFDVTVFEIVSITCPPDDSLLLCGPDTLFYQYSATSITNVSITPPAFISGDSIGVPILESGEFDFTLTGTGPCGSDSCSFTINATINSSPVVVAIPDTTVSACSLEEFCVPFAATDLDNNIDSIVGPEGVINGDQYCFTPDQPGEYRIIITAYDSCGAFGADTTYVRFVIAQADIICPDAQSRTICRGDSIKILVPITPYEAVVTILLNGQPNGYYNNDSAAVVLFPTDPGSFNVTVVAEAGCAVDSCVIALTVNFLELTEITCPTVIDTFLCPLEVDSICFPVTVVGSNVQITVSDNGSYANGFVCVPVSQDGTINVEIIAQGDCGVDTCVTQINVDADDAPILYLPADTVIERCDFDTTQICISGIYVEDDSTVTLSQVCGPGIFNLVTNDSGEVCFWPSGNYYGTYTFCFEAADGCNSRVDSFTVEIVEGPECSMCAVLSIDGGECIPVGRQHKIDINIETFRPIGGFELLISFDASVTSFQTATINGTAIFGWEYFTYRLNDAVCSPGCPTGLVRFTGIADVNNGSAHPPANTLTPNGKLISVYFQISNDQNLGGLFLPIRFVTYDCTDNAISDITGNDLFVDSRIYNYENIIIWDEGNDAAYPETSRPNGIGTADSCVDESAKVVPKRCIDFINGGICIIHPDSIDDRGDINLNNVAYEVADVVLFTNYFIYGYLVFTVNPAGQIAASDINADGITLSVADLVLMLRIIIGDEPPIPKINPHSVELELSYSQNDGNLVISEESVNGLGGAYLVYRFDNAAQFGTPELTSSTSHMDFVYHIEGNELRMLIYSMECRSIDEGKQDIVKIAYDGNAPVLVSSDFADAEGRPYVTAKGSAALPDGFELQQNYPNPFNPSTTVSFTLASQSEWVLTVYNVKGETVRRFNGNAQAGRIDIVWDGRNTDGIEVASGVYFYRLEALNKVDNKKMMLLK